MTWSFNPPTEPGTYWVKIYHDNYKLDGIDYSKPLAVTLVKDDAGELLVLQPGESVERCYKRDHHVRRPEGHIFDYQWWSIPLSAPPGYQTNVQLELRDAKSRRESLDARICELARKVESER